ncbi:hypothetical protein GGF31_002535 [Allomyces arbusculus]|nr:hypothetical protein GGF31_002535 [Allomyces arbusculus]
MTAVREAEWAPPQPLVDQRDNICLLEITITVLFRKELANMEIDVIGSISFLKTADAPGRSESQFATVIKAPPIVPVQSLDQKMVGTASMASVVVAVDVPRGSRVHDMSLDFTIVDAGKTTEPLRGLAPLGFLHFLHDPSVSDCAFLAKGTDTPLYATRMMLMCGSSYFRKMFSGPWAESAFVGIKDAIPFAWDAPVVALVFVHIYSGWTPDRPALPAETPDELVVDFACDPATLSFSTWQQLFELARYLQLKTLAIAVNRKLIGLLEEQSRELLQVPDEPMNDSLRSSKRRRLDSPGSAGAANRPGTGGASSTRNVDAAPLAPSAPSMRIDPVASE